MFDDAINQMAALPRWVQLWMRWLNISFLVGLLFIGNHVEARWALAAYFASFPIGLIAFYFIRDIKVTGLPHILFWVPLVAYVVDAALRDPGFQLFTPYGIWAALLGLTIAVSVIFDIKGVSEALLHKLHTE